MEHDRLNTPSTSAVTLEVLGYQLQFCQDPNSNHLGTTVWDASMVLVKFLEKNCRKGRFCPSKLKGKRVIELGAGCGVAGFGMALLGCDVVATDQIEVLPLLTRNIDRNTSRIKQMDTNSDSFGSIKAAELDWGNEDHTRAVDPPFDYIIGTDVVYAEHLMEPLLQSIFALSGPKTTILDMRSDLPVFMSGCLICGKETSKSKLFQKPRWIVSISTQAYSFTSWD
ncbi:uncharacterized protein [Euphorbia lathyris]|uniref:uncharacterized protein isoform X3 n=1 Tax=Euphorbia lathyris TaxID=212925 RepID=UPI00331428E4